MSIVLRICLIVVSILTMIFMVRKIKQSKLEIEYSLFWIAFSFLLIIFSVFPKIVIRLSDLLGFVSPSNLVFVIIIFLLLMKVFMLTIELSQFQNKVKALIQHLAILEEESEDN